MTDGALIEETETSSMSHDLAMILVQVTRDQPDCGLTADPSKAATWSSLVARQLLLKNGGRYLPKRDNRARRDAEVWADFNGKNHQAVMKKHNVSRRLLYSILERVRRSKSRA